MRADAALRTVCHRQVWASMMPQRDHAALDWLRATAVERWANGKDGAVLDQNVSHREIAQRPVHRDELRTADVDFVRHGESLSQWRPRRLWFRP